MHRAEQKKKISHSAQKLMEILEIGVEGQKEPAAYDGVNKALFQNKTNGPLGKANDSSPIPRWFVIIKE